MEDGSDQYTPTDPSPLLLVTELRGSLTGLDRCVKTYSFLPSEDRIPKILVNSSPSGNGECLFEEETNSSADTTSIGLRADTEEGACGGEGYDQDPEDLFDNELGEEYRNTFPRGGMDSFATDMFSTFESNLVKYRTQSLPDIYSSPSLMYHGSDDDDEDDRSLGRSPSSSASASTTSILNSSKDSMLDDTYSNGKYSPQTPRLNGHVSHAESVGMNERTAPEVNGQQQNGAESEGRRSDPSPSSLGHSKDSSISSEAYESCESEFSKSRPETPISPNRHLTSSYDDKYYRSNSLRRYSDDQISSSSVSIPGSKGKRHSTSSRQEDSQT